MSVKELESLTIEDAAALLQLQGSTATDEEIQANIEGGAPVNEDGTINLLRYTGWLVKSQKRERGGD